MARDIIAVQYPEMDDSQSVANAKVTKQTVTQANGIAIEKAFDNKNNSLVICVENTASSASSVTFKAGDNYPNAKLGDLEVNVDQNSLNVFQIQDPSRFENKDGSMNLDFKTGFTGNIFAIAKWAGVREVE